jgi:hypothetical protein
MYVGNISQTTADMKEQCCNEYCMGPGNPAENATWYGNCTASVSQFLGGRCMKGKQVRLCEKGWMQGRKAALVDAMSKSTRSGAGSESSDDRLPGQRVIKPRALFGSYDEPFR